MKKLEKGEIVGKAKRFPLRTPSFGFVYFSPCNGNCPCVSRKKKNFTTFWSFSNF